jgi:quercetin dioxygenase-like cupin family protein
MKSNEATHNRPQGDRVLDAPYVMAYLDERIDQLKREDAWKKGDRNGITLVKNEKMTIVLTCLRKDAKIRDSQLDGILTIEVLEGKITLTTEADRLEIKERGLITLRANISHSILALKKTTLLLTSHTH